MKLSDKHDSTKNMIFFHVFDIFRVFHIFHIVTDMIIADHFLRVIHTVEDMHKNTHKHAHKNTTLTHVGVAHLLYVTQHHSIVKSKTEQIE